MKQLTVISGKGGTGKTSIAASFAVLAGDAVVADCDVDAADLHLLLEPRIERRKDFTGGKRAVIDAEVCTACGLCEDLCRFDAIVAESGPSGATHYRVDAGACEGCGVCAWFCPAGAVEFGPAVNGRTFVSQTRCGPMVHAELDIAEENSGKLVSAVRQEARNQAERSGRELIIVDGSPGIGCPVIASITAADLVLIVSEPTLSGLHDLRRVAAVARHFEIPAMICVNKWDINPEIAERIERTAAELGLPFAGRVRYDKAVTQAQLRRQTVTEYTRTGSGEDIARLWSAVRRTLEGHA